MEIIITISILAIFVIITIKSGYKIYGQEKFEKNKRLFNAHVMLCSAIAAVLLIAVVALLHILGYS